VSANLRLRALQECLAGHEPHISTDGWGVRCRVAGVSVLIRFAPPEPAVVFYEPQVTNAVLASIGARLKDGARPRVGMGPDGRAALVVEAPVAMDDAIAFSSWVSTTIGALDRARAAADGRPVNRVPFRRVFLPLSGTGGAESKVQSPAVEDESASSPVLGLRQYDRVDRQFDPDLWAGINSAIALRVAEKSREALGSYRSDPLLIEEHANKELGTYQGGYGRRQVYELVQNAADELLGQSGGMIKLLLTGSALYCANEGRPISRDGVNAILMSDLSIKRGNEIGRFGLGFKSVLAITRRPLFVSRSGSFRFDDQAAEREIRAIAPSAERVPYLRTAIPIDPIEAARNDDELERLMAWATTVVKLPLDEAAAQWLHADLRDFPAEFLLFSPHVGRVVVEDTTTGKRREISLTSDPRGLVLSEDGKSTAWSIFQVDHRPSGSAKADAGEIASRDVVPVIWAVRRENARGRGDFWAFFPTEVKTTLSGIINAPWKTNEDRQNLLRGEFNEELLGVVAKLVVDNLEGLQAHDDPGRLFDIFPARGGTEAQSWADGILTDAIYDLAAGRPSIPDQTGRLAMPDAVKRPPLDVPPAALVEWCAYARRPMEWLHSSVATRERRSRVERLADKNRAFDYTAWLEALAADGSPAASIAALRTAAACISDGGVRQVDLAGIRRARIVLTADGSLVTVDPHAVFSGIASSSSGLAAFVHPAVQQDQAAIQILSQWGIRAMSPEADYALYLDGLTWNYQAWDEFWRRTALVPAERALEMMNARPTMLAKVRFKTAAGTFARRHEILLPGPILQEGVGPDSNITVDVAYHEQTMAVVRGLGVQAAPVQSWMPLDERWYREYLEEKIDEYSAATRGLPRKPHRDLLHPDQQGCLGPLEPILAMSDEAAARFMATLLNSDPDSRVWHIRHATSQAYQAVEVEDPLSWFIKRHGQVPTTRGPRPVSSAVGPALASMGAVLPSAVCSDSWAARLSLAQIDAEVPEATWRTAFTDALVEPATVASPLYMAACPYLPPPARLRCSIATGDGVALAADVVVTSSVSERDRALDVGAAVIYVPTKGDADALVAHWNLKHADGLAEYHASPVPAGEPQPLVEAFPALRPFIDRRQAQLEVIRCTDLHLETISAGGRRSSRTDFIHEDGRIYWVDDGEDVHLLERLSSEFHLGLTADDLAAVLVENANDQRAKLVVGIRQEPDAPTKLLRALGRDAVARRLPGSVLAGVEETRGRLRDADVAALADSLFGIDLFSEFRLELQQAGFDAPGRWAGSWTARQFVNSLGLPREYAGFEEPRVDPLLDVEGPSAYPVMHDFQQKIAGRIRQMLEAQSGKRALLSLPTGAGKTRVTVEALVSAVRDRGFNGPILWTAPTVELCEQAVQTWAQVWRWVGPSRRLHISRLWENKRADEISDDGVQVVVATDAKMGYVIDRPEYQWLALATAVVIDEAHGSTESGYTQILHWLGLGREQSKDRCPLIGLTATPFKGTSEEATLRLARRYGSRDLSTGVFAGDPYAKLQEMGVLAKVRQRILGGFEIELTPAEAAKAKELHRLPPEVEERVGEDKPRNKAILEAILSLPDDWKILVFAASVSHARQMAALLGLEGVSSAVISAETNPAARRHYVKQFNSGSLRVLTNYGVLAEGFDAPSTRAVIVARPTLSPNVYQQMIGRGLRGPLNGGKEECLIVNVQDNILHFGSDLAFHHFDRLFGDQ
jgi:superfamily II DNA or RNA helicase